MTHRSFFWLRRGSYCLQHKDLNIKGTDVLVMSMLQESVALQNRHCRWQLGCDRSPRHRDPCRQSRWLVQKKGVCFLRQRLLKMGLAVTPCTSLYKYTANSWVWNLIKLQQEEGGDCEPLCKKCKPLIYCENERNTLHLQWRMGFAASLDWKPQVPPQMALPLRWSTPTWVLQASEFESWFEGAGT